MNEMWKIMSTKSSDKMNSFDLTTEEEINMLDEVDGEFYNWDQNHSGFLWLTDECLKKYGLTEEDVEPIDWDIWDGEDDLEMRDKGFKWDFYVVQYASVHDKDGKYIRDCTYENWEVCKANGITEEMLDDEGCVIMGWCDG